MKKIPTFLNIDETIEFLNKKRKKAILGTVFIWTFFGIGFCSFFVFTLVGILAFNGLMTGLFVGLGIGLFFASGLLILLGYKFTKNYKYYFTNILVDMYAKEYYRDFKFDFNGQINKRMIADKEVLRRLNRAGECLYEGKINDILFSSSYYEYTGFEKWIKVKKGRAIVYKLPENSKYEYVLAAKKLNLNLKKLPNRYDDITESSEFNEKYDFYINDENNIYRVLTPKFIDSINEFASLYNCELSIVVKEKNVYVVVNNYNFFDFGILHKVDYDYILLFKQEILMVYRLAKILFK